MFFLMKGSFLMTKYRRIFIVCVLAFINVCAFAAAKPSILVVGSSGNDHMAGLKLFLIDPVLKNKLEEKGYNVAVSYYDDITDEILNKFNIVILVQEQILDTKSPQSFEIFKSKLPLIKGYVDSGGGLMVFFDERHYAKEWDFSINYCLQYFGAQMADEAFIESDKSNVHEFEMVPGQAAFKTTNIAAHPVTSGVESLWYPRMSRVIKASPDWDIIVRGEQTVKTEKTYSAAPPVVAVRNFGKGRVALFAGLSSFYILNGYHRTYDNAWMFTQGDGLLFFDNLYKWLAEPSADSSFIGGYNGLRLPDSAVQMGTRIDKIPFLQDARPQPGLIGVYTTYSGGQYTVGDFAQAAKKAGLKYIAITDRIINQIGWDRLVKDCAQVSDSDFVVMPGVEFTTSWRGDELGLQGFMINGDKWPPIYGNSFISTELRTGERYNSIVVVANPRLNSLPPWNVGGFHALEIMSYRGGEQYCAALDWYKWYQGIPAVGWYPVVSHRIWNLDQLSNAVANGYKNYLYSVDVDGIRDVAGEGLIPGFVSNGPVITKFKTDVIMRDPWEHYYLWTPGQICRICVEVESYNIIRDITLYSGNEIVRKFYPNTKKFTTVVNMPFAKEGSFYLEVTDNLGKNAYSYTIPTRNLNYWNHIGSDAMNDYHNPVNEDPYGDLLYEGKRYGYGGLVTFGYGWGNYIRYYHPVSVNEFHPLGYESGMIPAGLADVRTYPSVWYDNRGVHGNRELENALPRRSCPLSSADITLIREDVDFINDNGRAFETQYLNSSADVSLFRYEYKPFGYIIMPVESSIKVKTAEDQTLNLSSRNGVEIALLTLTFQTNKHFKTVSWIDANGQLQTEPIDLSSPQTVKMIKLYGGSYITLSPDPFGQVGLFVTQGDYDVEIIGGANPVIHIGHDMDGGKLNNGQIFEGHFIVLQEGGGQGQQICQKLYDQWGLDGECEYEPVMLAGKLEKAVYTVDMKSVDGEYGVVAEFGKIDTLANNLLPVTVAGLNSRWSAGIIRGDKLYPAGCSGDKMYAGIKTPLCGRFFLGNPIAADNEDLIIEIIKYDGGGIDIAVHNPTDWQISAKISANKNLADIIKLSRKITIDAGDTINLSGTISAAF